MKRQKYTLADAKRNLEYGINMNNKDLVASWESERTFLIELIKDFSKACPHGFEDWDECPDCRH